jgi:hypothetical protein
METLFATFNGKTDAHDLRDSGLSWTVAAG